MEKNIADSIAEQKRWIPPSGTMVAVSGVGEIGSTQAEKRQMRQKVGWKIMEIGDKYIWKPYNHATKSDDTDHAWYGHIVTVIGFETLDRVRISVDDFPNCNPRCRVIKNRFCADKAELFDVTHD